MSENKATFATGSLCLTDLWDQAKAAHPAYTRAANGKVYANVTIWTNEEPDQYGQHIKIKLNPPKDSEAEKMYVGRAKIEKRKGAEQLSADDPFLQQLGDDDLPF